MKLNEVGVIFRFDANFDLSAWTALTLVFTLPDGTQTTRTDPDVTVGTQDQETSKGLFLAFQYVQYTIVTGDLSQAGNWECYLIYDSGPNIHLISDTTMFFVENADC